jgi:uncharacterized membrane protein YhaH (DUF805 family)
MFSGWYNRAKYLKVTLLVMAPMVALAVFAAGSEGKEIDLLGLLSFISFAATSPILVKRLHDLDMPGWYCLGFLVPPVALVLGLILLLKKGTQGPNQYGEDPLAKA